MVIFINNKNQIKAVNSTNDPDLKAYELVEKSNPFNTWSIAKICCYEVEVYPEKIPESTENGTVLKETGKYFITMMAPYVDSHLIPFIDFLGRSEEQNATQTIENGGGLLELAEIIDENMSAILDMAEHIASLEERINKLEQTKEV